MGDLHTKIISIRATMLMKMYRAACPDIRLLYGAVDSLVSTPSFLPYSIRRNSTATYPLLLPLFEEIAASVKIFQTRSHNLKVGDHVWDSDVDGRPIGTSQGTVLSP